MKNKDFKELKASVKEGGKMLRVSEDMLQKLIDIGGKGDGFFNMHYTDKYIVPALEELLLIRKQNKLLIRDVERLADFLNREVGVYEGGNSFKCVFCGETNGVHAPDCPFGKMMNKHEELKAQIE